MFGWYTCSSIRLWKLLVRSTHLVQQSVLNIWNESTSIEKTVLPLECDLRPIDLTSLVSIIRAPQPLGWGPVRNRVPQQGVSGRQVKLHLLLSTPLLALLPEAPLSSSEKLPSMKPVPSVKKVGDCCFMKFLHINLSQCLLEVREERHLLPLATRALEAEGCPCVTPGVAGTLHS